MTDPENILYFGLGVLSVFNTYFDTLYRNIQPVIAKFRQCATSVVDAIKLVGTTLETKDKEEDSISKDKNIIEFLANMKDNASQIAYCKKVKAENEEIYDRAEVKKNDRDYDIFDLFALFFKTTVGKKFATSTEYCQQVYTLKPKHQAEIAERFTSIENYIQQCMYFKELDCDKINAEPGIMDFIGKAYKYYKVINSVKTCIVNVLGSDDTKSNQFQKSFLHDIIAGAVGVTANIFTFGAWGGIKGGYWLIQLAIDLKTAYDDTMKDLAFNIGKLIGKGVMIAKSIILGRRKLRHRKDRR